MIVIFIIFAILNCVGSLAVLAFSITSIADNIFYPNPNDGMIEDRWSISLSLKMLVYSISSVFVSMYVIFDQ